MGWAGDPCQRSPALVDDCVERGARRKRVIDRDYGRARSREELKRAVQLNGKLVDRVPAPADSSREQLEEIARNSGKLAARLNGKEVVKAVVVPGKLVNFVVR